MALPPTYPQNTLPRFLNKRHAKRACRKQRRQQNCGAKNDDVVSHGELPCSYYWAGGSAFFGPAIFLRGFIAGIIWLVDSQFAHGCAFQMINQGRIIKPECALGNFRAQRVV